MKPSDATTVKPVKLKKVQARGRIRQTLASRQRYIDAAQTLMLEGNVAPSVEEASIEAGRNRRSGFDQFSAATLHLAALEDLSHRRKVGVIVFKSIGRPIPPELPLYGEYTAAEAELEELVSNIALAFVGYAKTKESKR